MSTAFAAGASFSLDNQTCSDTNWPTDILLSPRFKLWAQAQSHDDEPKNPQFTQPSHLHHLLCVGGPLLAEHADWMDRTIAADGQLRRI